jgi:hypothetical protein
LPKRKMELLLDGLAGRAGRSQPGTSRVHPGDEQDLAGLILEAYRGTADDEGATLEEALEAVRHTFSGRYGEFLWEHSFLAEEGGEGLPQATRPGRCADPEERTEPA